MVKMTLQGLAGEVQAQLDEPSPSVLEQLPGGVARGHAFIAHPHPLYSGTMDNKVVQTMARAFTQAGWRALRFNFRGVGESAGQYDAGIGESLDMLHIIQQLSPAQQAQPIAVAGFSFGAFVASRVVSALVEQQPSRLPEHIVLVGTAASRFTVPPIAPELHPRTLVVHGEDDDTVPFSACLDWARPQNLPLTVVPLGGHFFHGQLITLRHLISKHIS